MLTFLLPHQFQFCVATDDNVWIGGEIQASASALVFDLSEDQLNRLELGEGFIIRSNNEPGRQWRVQAPQYAGHAAPGAATRPAGAGNLRVDLGPRRSWRHPQYWPWAG